MSTWTHVAAVFRVEAPITDRPVATRPDWDAITGKVIYEPPPYLSHNTYESRKARESWAEYAASPEDFVPAGSEGSLQRLVWVEPDPSLAARYVVTVYGDLRDYDDPDAIERWFDAVCSRCDIRQAICHVMVDLRCELILKHTWEDRHGS